MTLKTQHEQHTALSGASVRGCSSRLRPPFVQQFLFGRWPIVMSAGGAPGSLSGLGLQWAMSFTHKAVGILPPPLFFSYCVASDVLGALFDSCALGQLQSSCEGEEMGNSAMGRWQTLSSSFHPAGNFQCPQCGPQLQSSFCNSECSWVRRRHRALNNLNHKGSSEVSTQSVVLLPKRR